MSSAPNARRIRLAATPSTSVVVVSRRSLPELEAVLSSLERQCRELGAELIVARSEPDNPVDMADLRGRFPSAVFVDGENDTGQLRAAALRVATGDIVAFTDDSQSVTEDWLESFSRRRALR